MNIDSESLVREAVKNLVAEHGKKNLDAFDSLLKEISVALGDLVAAAEDTNKGDALAKALTAALKSVRIEVAAPKIVPNNIVNVSPTPVHNHNHMPEPVVQILERATPAKGWTIDFKFNKYDNVPIGATLTRIN